MDTATIPFDMLVVFDAIQSIFTALPFTVQVAFIGCFSIVCFFVIIRLLF